MSSPARSSWLLASLAVMAAGFFGSCAPSLETLLRRGVLGPRPTLGRLSWSPEYAPYHPAPRDATETRYAEVLDARSRVELRAAARGSADDLHTLGMIDLLVGRPDRAVAVLERAASRSPRDAGVLSDLAAARLSRAERDAKGYEVLPALAEVDRAVALDPTSPAARFNRALVLEALGLLEHARTAWADYLKLDSSSGWAEEARARHEALGSANRQEQWARSRGRLDRAAAEGDEPVVAELVARFAADACIHAEDELLAEWARAWRRGDANEAAARLRIARRIADELASRGEHLPVRAVAAVEKASGDFNRTAALAAGHLAYRNARELYASRRLARSRAPFELAERALRRGGSPVADLATAYLTTLQADRRSAEAILERLLRRPELVDCPRLRGKVLWNLGLWELLDGDPAIALTYFESARPIAKRFGYVENAASLDVVLALNLRYLGESGKAWAPLLRSLPACRAWGWPEAIRNSLGEAMSTCLAMGLPAVARYYRDEMRHLTAGAGVLPARALIHDAEAREWLGDLRTATEDLARARSLLPRIPDENERGDIEVELLFAEARLGARFDFAGSIRRLTDDLRNYPLGRFYLTRARVEMAAGDLDAAEADLDRGIELYEGDRRFIQEERFRISYFDRARDLFAEMVRLQVRRGHGARAFDYAERRRARSLLDRLGGEPLGWRDITAALPEGVAVCEYALLDDQLLIWVLRHDRIETLDRAVPRPRIEALAERFRAGLEGPPTGAWREISGALDEVLVEPLRPYLDPGDLLVVVPDGALHSTPFAALRDRRTGRYLVEEHALAYAPSATFFLRTLARSRELGPPRGAPTALAVGDPSPRSSELDLPALPHAAAEAAEVAARLPGSELLLNAEATRGAFLAGAARHPILHFAGHAVVDRDLPLSSYLLLAPAPGERSGALSARDLSACRLERTRLAVLSACNTAGGATTGEGVLSLARAFLGAGVPTVVASLSSLDDAEAARFLAVFYRGVAAGHPPAWAMRRTQCALLGEGLPPRAWAAFQLIGAPL